MRLSWGTVLSVTEETNARQKVEVGLDGPEAPTTAIAFNYLAIAPACSTGDRVLLNMTSLDLGLGTGGVAFVVPAGEKQHAHEGSRGRGHIMKLRYTPLQCDVLALEEPASPYHSALREAQTIGVMPVVCCALASQVPLVAAAVKAGRPEANVVLCMTDEASLMYAFSDLFSAARSVGLLDTAITCGQALGADLEAVTLHSALLAASHALKADMCIVSIGPGTPGSATPFGHGGIAQGEALNAVASLGGIPIAVLRVSFADSRARHIGISHHSITALGRICLAPVYIPVPTDIPPSQLEVVEAALDDARLFGCHHIRKVDPGTEEVDLRGLSVTTMGRTQADDPAFYSAAFAAGRLAASYI